MDEIVTVDYRWAMNKPERRDFEHFVDHACGHTDRIVIREFNTLAAHRRMDARVKAESRKKCIWCENKADGQIWTPEAEAEIRRRVAEQKKAADTALCPPVAPRRKMPPLF